MDDDELLAELGLNSNNKKNDITELRCKPQSEIRQSNKIVKSPSVRTLKFSSHYLRPLKRILSLEKEK